MQLLIISNYEEIKNNINRRMNKMKLCWNLLTKNTHQLKIYFFLKGENNKFYDLTDLMSLKLAKYVQYSFFYNWKNIIIKYTQ